MTSIDPVPAIAAICKREQVWLHVDGAYGGVLAVAPEYRHILDGVELADRSWSIPTNGCSHRSTARPFSSSSPTF
jgi:glutamate/tyrosine decarboxylase-like PLP-dependent enzyme